MDMTPASKPAHGLLGRWYADPLGEAALRRLQARLRRCGRRPPCGGVAHGLRVLIVNHALGRIRDGDYLSALHAAGDRRRARALVELVYGQLLMSRRLPAAMAHLDAGFDLARHLLAPRDYFAVRKRHALLRCIVPRIAPAAPTALADLLREAAVIRCLTRVDARPAPGIHDSTDTLG